jgi:polyhydroxybutyrate depolymerase
MMRQRYVQISLIAVPIVILMMSGCTTTTSTPTPIPPTVTPGPTPTPEGGCGVAPPAVPGETEVLSISVDGLEREYHLHLPPDYDQNIPTSLVLAFHWYQGTAHNMETLTWLSRHADEHGYIVVYPQSTSFEGPNGTVTSWNDLSCSASSGPEGATCTEKMAWPYPPECGEPRDCVWCTCYDDLAFIDQLLDELEDSLCIDQDRVYATGISNGATFVHRLGCDMEDRLAAIAPIAGTLAKGFNCAPEVSTSTSIMHLHGDHDFLLAADGSEGINGHLNVPVDDVVDAWASTESQGCDDVETPYPTAKDGTMDFSCIQRANCETGAEVVSCTWDGNHDSSMEISWQFGNDVMWDFFDKNSKQK